jgi:SAM-dependent methyltransferase
LTFTIETKTELGPNRAFDSFFDEFIRSIADEEMQLEHGRRRRILSNGKQVGRFISWRRGKEAVLEWNAGDGMLEGKGTIEFSFRNSGQETELRIRSTGWEGQLGGSGESFGWFAGQIASAATTKLAAARVGDWITDRHARKPSGPRSRRYYRNPLYHRPNFMLLLNRLDLTKRDYLLEVGCGGGAFLKEALASGCRAAALDHSRDMVQEAARQNSQAIQEGRLVIRLGDAERIPFPDGEFTCAVMTGVFGFLSNPTKALEEVRRALAPGGRLYVYTGSKELRGTPAAPEPAASRIHWYSDRELKTLALTAGFAKAAVERPDVGRYAAEVGIPSRDRPLFEGRNGQLLKCEK